MRVATKLTAFGAALVVAFGAGAAVGATVGPAAGTDEEPVTVVTQPVLDHDVHGS